MRGFNPGRQQIICSGKENKSQTEILFEKLSKRYKTLWITLSSDKSVIEEYKTFADFKVSAREEISICKESENIYYENDFDPKDNVNETSMKERSYANYTNGNDFLTVIERINNVDSKGSTKMSAFQISSSCCNIFGCNNNCSEPILEGSFHEDQFIATSDNREREFYEEEITITKTSDECKSSNGNNRASIGSNIAKDHNVHSFSTQVQNASVSTSSSESSGGSTVIEFDLSHLSIKDIDEAKKQIDESRFGKSDDGVDKSGVSSCDKGGHILIGDDASFSSEEAEWTENEKSSDSLSKDEPKYNVVILSSDESITSENDSTESQESIQIIDVFDDDSDDDLLPSNSENIKSNSSYDSGSFVSKPSKPDRSQSFQINKGSRTKFRTQREQLTKSTFNTFNFIVFEGKLAEVEVIWSKRLTSTAGLTRLRRTKTGSRIASIELSNKLIDDEVRLQATLMHEMCHAAAWLVDNVNKPPHGQCFKKWATLAMRRVPGLIVSTTHEYVTNTYKFAWKCTNESCDFVVQRHSRSVDVNRHCCGKCKCKLIEIEVPTPESLKRGVFTPKQKRSASAFSLFVQQHSKTVRKELQCKGSTRISQQDVMKECARLWNDHKNNQMLK